MTGLLIEVVLAFAAIAILVALVWLILDYRDLRAKQIKDREDTVESIADLQQQITKLAGVRMGPGTRP